MVANQPQGVSKRAGIAPILTGAINRAPTLTQTQKWCCGIVPGVLYSPGMRGSLQRQASLRLRRSTGVVRMAISPQSGLKSINHHLHCLSPLCACLALKMQNQWYLAPQEQKDRKKSYEAEIKNTHSNGEAGQNHRLRQGHAPKTCIESPSPQQITPLSPFDGQNISVGHRR